MKRFAFIIDVAKCENCNNCFLSCKDEHCGNDWPGYGKSQPLHGQRWMNIETRERGAFPQIDVAYLAKPCQHCDDAPCVRAGQGAVVKRDDGIVLIDPEKARGMKNLIAACPYGAIWWNDELQLPQKCTMCAHLLDRGWRAPRCVQACPTGALTLFHGEDEELAELVRTEELATFDTAGPATKPRCFYQNLHRFTDDCLVGSVAAVLDGVSECLAGATVRLRDGRGMVAEQQTDDFGDFKFDRLPAAWRDRGHELEVVYRNRIAATISLGKGESSALGTIWIELDEAGKAGSSPAGGGGADTAEGR